MVFRPADEDRHEKHYARLARRIRADIEEGRLLPGQRMPTVKEMCSKSGLSAGTVRQAYGLLKTQGLIELTPGRGTFVSVPKVNEKSRKAQAMDAIDRLFQALAGMGFSQAESRMFVSLRLAQMDQDQYVLPVALIAQSPESLRCAFNRISELQPIDLIAFSMEEIRASGAVALSDFPLVLCESPLLNEISALLSERADAICPFALAVSPASILHLADLRENDKACVYAQSESFFEIVKKTVKSLSLPAALAWVPAGGLDEHTLKAFTRLITPSDALAFASDHERRLILDFTKSNSSAIAFDLTVDEGSMIAVSRRVSVLAERH